MVVVFDRRSNTGVMYESRAGDRELTFEAFGEWGGPRSELRDRETGTIWTALTGVATDGPLAEDESQTRALSPVVLVCVDGLEP